MFGLSSGLSLCLLAVLAVLPTESFNIRSKPEKPTDHAKVARQLVHKAEWTPFTTISTEDDLQGYPMASVIAVADSTRGGKSTGNIYFYLTHLDYPAKDVKKHNYLTMLFSDDLDLSCTNRGVDPMEPTCARATISGAVVELDLDSDEYKQAKAAIHSRHPAADSWVAAHRFVLYKLDIKKIIVLDWYGGPNHVTESEYFAVQL